MIWPWPWPNYNLDVATFGRRTMPKFVNQSWLIGSKSSPIHCHSRLVFLHHQTRSEWQGFLQTKRNCNFFCNRQHTFPTKTFNSPFSVCLGGLPSGLVWNHANLDGSQHGGTPNHWFHHETWKISRLFFQVPTFIQETPTYQWFHTILPTKRWWFR